MCAKWVPKLWILSEKSKNFDKKCDPNQSEPNQSEPNQSKPNQSKPNQSEQNQSKPNQSNPNQNFLKSRRAPWSYFFREQHFLREIGVQFHLVGRYVLSAGWCSKSNCFSWHCPHWGISGAVDLQIKKAAGVDASHMSWLKARSSYFLPKLSKNQTLVWTVSLMQERKKENLYP